MRADIDLPSGVRARVLITERCAVIEANGLVTYAPNPATRLEGSVPVEVVLELAELLAELGAGQSE